MILDVFRCSQLFSNVFSSAAIFMHNHPCADILSQDDVRCSRNVFRCSRDVFRCSRDVFRCTQLFSDVLRIPSIDHRYSIEILRFVQDVLRCAQMFSDVHRCFQMITDVFGFSLDLL